MDFAQARHWMVEAQIRTADVTDVPLLQAFARLPRERFVPAPLATLAYADLEVEVGPDRRLLRPREVAKLMQALGLKRGDRVLEIASATGYGAAVAAALGCQVVALEPEAELSRAANAAFEAAGVSGITSAITSPLQGWSDAAPYDAIFLNGGAEWVPEAWIAQLAEGGRLAVIERAGPAGAARLYTRSGGVVASRTLFDAAPTLAPGLARPRAFTF